MVKIIKKSAMFGLDARIALAIFGALSVITGATLYSAIQNSRVIALISQLEEVSKAVDSYRIDTASLPVLEGVPNGGGYFNVTSRLSDITSNAEGKIGWNGPYFPMNVYNNMSLSFEQYLLQMDANADRPNAAFNISTSQLCNKSTGKCNLYIKLLSMATDKARAVSLFNGVEEYIDGPMTADSYRTGKIRLEQSSNTTSYLDATALGQPALLYIIGPYPRNHLN